MWEQAIGKPLVEEESVLEHLAERSQRGDWLGARPACATGEAEARYCGALGCQHDAGCLDGCVGGPARQHEEAQAPFALMPLGSTAAVDAERSSISTQVR